MVQGKYPDYASYDNFGRFYLNADKGFNPFKWAPPINWTGRCGGMEVKFTQITSGGYDRDCYDWTGFPNELHSAIPYIVEAIDKAMKVMD